ncbi:uncharacterized protein LOC123547321 [Mercenaria mercenaria]|uniref:uncharacterized protein LOC123547321 n=1 Tax=Mercenaria mercenaria TaxID=6596 RepID=UPI00234EB424|nr:uncharacterized protein LOC123547321 [Mercenaria mercenaria]XP_045190258.2 uncharacterized protein LOC123547321 [Mercenaria mercenaria]
MKTFIRTNSCSYRTRFCTGNEINRTRFERQQSCNLYRTQKSSSNTKYNQSGDEVDGIYLMERCEIIMSKAPKSLPASFNKMSPDEQPLLSDRTILHRFGIVNDKPGQKSSIFILHNYEGRPVLDEFGAELWTFQSSRKDGIVYNHHFLVNVKTDGPAAIMKISNYDEIVLLNNSFVPDLTHTDVRNLFHKVKIDGMTRFKLIIRRVVEVRSKKQWEWIDTSAVLAPDAFQKHDNYPTVEAPKVTQLPGDVYEMRTIQFFKIPGTQYYLDIKNESVVADVLTNTDADKTKRICKILRYSMKSDGLLHFTAALCSTINTRYIVVGQGNQIELDKNPMWFEVLNTGNNIQFKMKDMFLAFNSKTLKIEVGHSEYMFSEFPADEGLDHPDISVSIPSDNSSLCFDTRLSSSSNDIPACNSVPPSQALSIQYKRLLIRIAE